MRRSNMAAALLWLSGAAAWAQQSDMHICGSEGDAAVTACTRIIEAAGTSNDDRTFALNARGRRFAHDYRLADPIGSALADFTASLALDDEQDGILRERGDLYRRMRDADRALHDYGRAFVLGHPGKNLFASIAEMHLEKGYATVALEFFDEATRLEPGVAIFRIGAGLSWYQQRRYDLAAQEFAKALTLNSPPRQTILFLHFARLRAGQAAGATQELREAIERATTGGELWRVLQMEPLLELILGKRSFEAYLVDAQEVTVCGRSYFLGMWLQGAGNAAEAEKAFRDGEAEPCEIAEIWGRIAARAELERLKASNR